MDANKKIRYCTSLPTWPDLPKNPRASSNLADPMVWAIWSMTSFSKLQIKIKWKVFKLCTRYQPLDILYNFHIDRNQFKLNQIFDILETTWIRSGTKDHCHCECQGPCQGEEVDTLYIQNC